MMAEEEVDTEVEEEVAEVDMVVVGPMVTVMEEAVAMVVDMEVAVDTEGVEDMEVVAEDVEVMEGEDMEVEMDTVVGAVEGTVVMVEVAVAMEVVATKHLMITRFLFFASKRTECCFVN